jgi:hypothetical protein
MYNYNYEGQFYLRGRATPARYSYTYEEQLNTRGSSTHTRYIFTYEVKLHLRGTATPLQIRPHTIREHNGCTSTGKTFSTSYRRVRWNPGVVDLYTNPVGSRNYLNVRILNSTGFESGSNGFVPNQ